MHLFTYVTVAALAFSELASARYMGIGRRTPKEAGICFEPMDCLITGNFGASCSRAAEDRYLLGILGSCVKSGAKPAAAPEAPASAPVPAPA